MGRIEEHEEKVRAKPGDTLARFVLAKDLLESGANERAAEHFRVLVGLKPDWMKAWTLLGESLDRLGRREEAREALEEALRLARAQSHAGPESEIAERLAAMR